MSRRLLIVGNLGGTNVGDSLAAAAEAGEIPTAVVETRLAYGGPRVWRALRWRLGRQPSTPGRFDRAALAAVGSHHPNVLVSMGVYPLSTEVVGAARSVGACVVNYLTDDPWNPAHRNERFLRSLPHYDVVFTPRRANIRDLNAAGARRVEYLPFAYDPRHVTPDRGPAGAFDVLFVGGGDADRVRLVSPLLQSGFRVGLYGDYWANSPLTRPADHGHAPPGVIARETSAAKVCLILVRRANRDGHVMRSFEAAACGGCLLVEDTDEHRDIFADTVTYFRTADDLVGQARDLQADPDRRRASAEASHRRVVIDGANTYADRLRTILDVTRE